MNIRIGPRKLRRVLQYAKSSTITRQLSDYKSDNSRSREPLPKTIEGNSYFDLPRSQDPRTPSSLITPTSFMDASSVKTPETLRQAESPVENPAGESTTSDTKQPAGDTILLVEDNAINMRVRHSPLSPVTIILTTILNSC
jgi:hypothetical protein